MKFFHVYNEEYFEGLVKNNLINKDSGFKIQHVFSLPKEKKFNVFAAKGTKLGFEGCRARKGRRICGG